MNYPTLYLTETSLPEVVFTGGHCEAGKSELEPMRRAPTGKYLSKTEINGLIIVAGLTGRVYLYH